MQAVTVDDLLSFMPVESVEREQAQLALDAAIAMVDAYCRGAARSGGVWRPGVPEVVLGVAARIAANPMGVQWREQAGQFSVHRGEGFKGFTLAEQYVLNRYRKRAM